MMKKIFFIPIFFIVLGSFAQTLNDISIVPMPAEINLTGGYLTIKEPVGFIVNEGSKKDPTILFKKNLEDKYGFQKFVDGDTHSYGLPAEIFIVYDQNYLTKEGYEIEITKKDINIRGTERGVFNALQTLEQLFPLGKSKELKIPCCKIKDSPRFTYRGMHLDVARHFFPIPFIKKYIDYLAYHKLNTFHWHLTDDQGWRIEIKKYPKLTSVGGYRSGTIIGRHPGTGNDSIRYGGFYTQTEIKEIVKYAADRYITVIPEIEMPGHASAAIAAYPQLSCFPDESTKVPEGTTWSGSTTGKQVQQTWGVFEDVFCPSEYTFKFLDDVLDEVIQLFPSKYIHIGGDECPKENWKRSEFCQKLIKEKELKDEHGLQSYFIQRIEKYINSKGRKIIGWDEILEGGLAPNATVMSWRGEEGGIAATQLKHNVIMTPTGYCYFDYSQTKKEDSVTIGGYLPLETVYNYEPISTEMTANGANFILGAQANLWTEYITNAAKVEYMIFPRMSALSEVLWRPKEKRNWKDFERRLPAIMKRYKQWGASYSTAYFDLQATVLPTENYQGVLWKLETKNKDNKIIYVKGKTNNASFDYNAPVLIKDNAEYGAAVTDESHKIISDWAWQKVSFNKATGKKITIKDEPSSKYHGNGAFTLVNGVITDKGLTQSSEWLGFEGKDLEAVIDLGKEDTINRIRLNVLEQEGSWIYLPASVEFYISNDGINYTATGKQNVSDSGSNTNANDRAIEQKLDSTLARYVKVIARNYGIIPSGKQGAGNPAWLFIDEIEIE